MTKTFTKEKQVEIINGIISSDVPSKIAQLIAKYLSDEFAKLPEVTPAGGTDGKLAEPEEVI